METAENSEFACCFQFPSPPIFSVLTVIYSTAIRTPWCFEEELAFHMRRRAFLPGNFPIQEIRMRNWKTELLQDF
jgi:hypothetical protein